MGSNVVKTIKYLSIGILAIIAALIIYVFIQTKVSPDKIPSLFGYKPFVVLSSSMEKEIYKGDLVVVKNVSVEDLKRNDIIAFKDEDGYVVTHRIVEIKTNNGKHEITTKGDNNNTEDPYYVKEENIEGVYKFKISGAGNVILILQEPITLIIILAVIFIVGFGLIINDNYKMSLNEKKELEELREKVKKD